MYIFFVPLIHFRPNAAICTSVILLIIYHRILCKTMPKRLLQSTHIHICRDPMVSAKAAGVCHCEVFSSFPTVPLYPYMCMYSCMCVCVCCVQRFNAVLFRECFYYFIGTCTFAANSLFPASLFSSCRCHVMYSYARTEAHIQ